LTLRLPFPDVYGNKFTDEAVQRNFETIALQSGDQSTITTLPTVPFNGQEVFYLADDTNGIVWHLKYREASASTYKWEVVGGPPMFAYVGTQQSIAFATYGANYTSTGMTAISITAPLAGDYDVEVGAQVFNATACQANMSYDIGGTGAVDGDSWEVGIAVNTYPAGSSARRKTALAASTALVAKYKTSAGTAFFAKRWMRVTPIRVI